MLSAIRFRNRETQSYIDAYLSDRGSSGGYTIKGVEGLGPVKSDVAYSDYALLPGGVFHSTNVGVRNIVVTIGFQPNYQSNQTIQSMRRELYGAITSGDGVTLSMFFHGVGYSSYIHGYVESVEPNIFSAEPTVQVSIICVEPFFSKPTANSDTFTAGTSNHHTIVNGGDVNVGFIFTFTPNLARTFVQITHVDTGDVARVVHNIAANERLVLDTRPGRKDVRITSSAGVTLRRVMGDLTITGKWPILTPGDNTLYVTHTEGSPVGSADLSWRDQYQGV